MTLIQMDLRWNSLTSYVSLGRPFTSLNLPTCQAETAVPSHRDAGMYTAPATETRDALAPFPV